MAAVLQQQQWRSGVRHAAGCIRRSFHSTPFQQQDVVARLRWAYQSKKSQHVQAAKRDGATILSVSGDFAHPKLIRDANGADNPAAIYGFGLTSPYEV